MTQPICFVIAVGNAFDGLHLEGMFASAVEAEEFASSHYRNEAWSIVGVFRADDGKARP